MAYYDESCIERMQIIQGLKERRYFPLYLIKNVLRRMDEGLSLPEAESVENAVFGSDDRIGRELIDRPDFLAATGLTEKELKQFIVCDKLSFRSVGKLFDVSGNTIKKRCKKLGII